MTVCMCGCGREKKKDDVKVKELRDQVLDGSHEDAQVSHCSKREEA